MAKPDDAQLIDLVRAHPPEFFQMMGGWLESADSEAGLATVHFDLDTRFTHTNGTIVQGGFVTTMLDAAMAHTVLIQSALTMAIPTLEIQVHFLRAAGPGKFRAEGRIVRRGKSIAFLEADLYDAKGTHIARGSSTVKLVPFA